MEVKIVLNKYNPKMLLFWKKKLKKKTRKKYTDFVKV